MMFVVQRRYLCVLASKREFWHGRFGLNASAVNITLSVRIHPQPFDIVVVSHMGRACRKSTVGGLRLHVQKQHGVSKFSEQSCQKSRTIRRSRDCTVMWCVLVVRVVMGVAPWLVVV